MYGSSHKRVQSTESERKKAYAGSSLLILLMAGVSAAPASAEEHIEHHHGYGSGSLEIGLSNSLVYELGEKHFAYGLHVHGIYTFAESPFALGLGYELILGEHLHQTVGPMFCYRPTDPFNLCLAPGVTFEEDEIGFAVHLEATYEFTLGALHLGPTLGFAYSLEETHLSLGLHTGFEF
jgi:hypothetical protein